MPMHYRGGGGGGGAGENILPFVRGGTRSGIGKAKECDGGVEEEEEEEAGKEGKREGEGKRRWGLTREVEGIVRHRWSEFGVEFGGEWAKAEGGGGEPPGRAEGEAGEGQGQVRGCFIRKQHRRTQSSRV